ncbi:hypothetical protein [Sphingomonas sp. MMS24-J13]|uniref:hypothetical protein n=1 Tax=Sphingomonas sp. MMS24-J13 TaxID=3238686 RepID=UPI00384D2983
MPHGLGGPLRRATIGVAIGLMSADTPAYAAGGPDIVDDAFAETPKVCHLESWLIAPLHGDALTHAGIGCTFAAVPRLELDGAVEYQRGNADGPWSFQPTAKYTLLVHPGVFAIGLSGAGFVDRHGHLDGFAVDMPASFTRGRFTTINVDIGCVGTLERHAPAQYQVSWGVQIVQAIAPHFSLMGEVFGVEAQKPGEQAGVRWSPGPQKVDIDLRASHGGTFAGTALTLGITFRV